MKTIYAHQENMEEIDLTEEELKKVNSIIEGIQSDINNAIESINKGDFESAITHIRSGISRSNCPMCKRELSILEADIVHNKSVCIVDEELCSEEKESIILNAERLKNEFVPLTTTKKAIKDKAKSLISHEDKSAFYIESPISLINKIIESITEGRQWQEK